MDQEKVEQLTRQLLEALGEDPNREGLLKTPARVARAYTKLFEGYRRSFRDEITVFNNEYGYDDIVYSGQISFFSTCEHHLQSFYGIAHVGYVPDKHIIGLSKLSRVIDIYARRLQEQERITVQAAEELMGLLAPKGVAIMLESQHFCNMARGVQQRTANMKTITFRGVFKDDKQLQERFMQLAA
jgi:GTP cyclohydrolase IA